MKAVQAFETAHTVEVAEIVLVRLVEAIGTEHLAEPTNMLHPVEEVEAVHFAEAVANLVKAVDFV